jgi:hypothetical protein
MFTERQRRYFHAAEERGEPGMKKLADEADSMPVKKYEGGEVECPHCGNSFNMHDVDGPRAKAGDDEIGSIDDMEFLRAARHGGR